LTDLQNHSYTCVHRDTGGATAQAIVTDAIRLGRELLEQRGVLVFPQIGFNDQEQIAFTKTLGESDVYLFAGITGDMHRNHIDEEYMKGTPYGGRIVQGALLVGLTAGCSSILCSRLTGPVVSYGYDRIRFIRGVRIGDTVTVRYVIARKDEAEAKTFADITLTNQRGETVLEGFHVYRVLEPSAGEG
jgi:acyl dehydratase